MEGGGACPVGGVWSTGSAGAIGSDCRQVSAIRPNQEVCIYVSALPFSRGGRNREQERLQRLRETRRQRAWQPCLDPCVKRLVFYDLPVVRFSENKPNERRTANSVSAHSFELFTIPFWFHPITTQNLISW